MSEFLFGSKTKLIKKSDFLSKRKIYNNLQFMYWLLSCELRHLWRHHYVGTQGIILIFSTKFNKISEKHFVEMKNILMDENLIEVPILLIRDKYIFSEVDFDLFSILKNQLKLNGLIINSQLINFQDKDGMEEINYGIDWLSQKMTPIK